MKKPKRLLLQINIQVRTEKRPHIELRRTIYDNNIIKLLIECALQEKPVVIQPFFFNKIKSVSSLLEAGIMSYDADAGQYEYNI